MARQEGLVIAHQLIFESKLCVLATASLTGKPEAATIEYVADPDYTIYFETFPDYRKYQNLKENPRASLVITSDPHTVQMDGTVEVLPKEASRASIQLLIIKYGAGSGYYTDETITLFRFTPTWIRVLISKKWPPQYEMILGK